MDFTKSLVEVAKNRQNFKTWEDNQQDNKAQREALYKKRQHSEAEIAQAKQLGERIVDVVDIMDNHSENVAENVETATQPLVGLVPLIPLLGGGYVYAKHIAYPNKLKVGEVRRNLFYNKEVDSLSRKISESIKKGRPTAKEFGVGDFSRKSRIDKIKDVTLKKEAMELFNKFKTQTAKFSRSNKIGLLSVAGAYIATFIGANIYAAKLQVDSSRIARYQAREILADPKAFVNYTPEQIAEAKKYVKEHPELKKEKKKEKLKSGMVKSIINIVRDRKAYIQAKKADNDEAKKVSRALSAEELVQAKKDQEVIQRSVRLINNEAEKYSENMEVAANVIMGTTPLVGGLMGWVAGVLMNKTGLSGKIVDNIVKNYCTDEAKEAYATFKAVKPKAPGYTRKWGKFIDKLWSNDYKPVFDNAGNEIVSAAKNSKKGEYAKGIKKFFATALSHHALNSKFIGLAMFAISGIPAALIALKLQKASARAGRYTAKRELEKDPRNFIGYTEEDMKEVKEVKGKKQTTGGKIKEYALFLPNVLKQYYAYEKYKKGEFKDHKVLLDQLQKYDVNETQLKDAKNLQRKLFNTFEKVDDNSQTYSESMEAATEILQPMVITGGYLTMMSPFIYAGVQISRGKMTAATLLNKITGLLSKASGFLKSKVSKKYLEDVAKAVPHKVGNIELDKKPLAFLIKDINFENDSILSVGQKLIENLRKSSGIIRKMENRDQIKVIESVEKYFDKFAAIYGIKDGGLDELQRMLKLLKSKDFDPNVRANMLSIMLVDDKAVGMMSKGQLKTALGKMVELFGADSNDAKTLQAMLQEADIKSADVCNKMREFNRGIEDTLVKLGINDKKISDIPEMLKILARHQDDVLSSKASGVNAGARALEAPVGASTSSDVALGVTGKWEKLVDSMLDPKDFVSRIKKEIVNMPEEKFAAYADKYNFGSMDKKTFLDILPKIEKIMGNIPAAELKQIQNALLKELKEHPDEFIKLVTSGRIKQIFMTKSLIAASAAVGISWFTLNFVITYAIEAWLADIQLKAGRLGVMKAMESLQDPAYYANIEVDEKSQPKAPSAQVASPSAPATGSLLDKFKK